ncbi:hypothetical protein NSERUTF1_7332 [Nocardia seriolae]|nr:hypothetical protein NSERUTF1_7332 [Nocardia seriolae]
MPSPRALHCGGELCGSSLNYDRDTISGAYAWPIGSIVPVGFVL